MTRSNNDLGDPEVYTTRMYDGSHCPEAEEFPERRQLFSTVLRARG